MTALAEVAAYVPERRVTVAELAEPLQLTEIQVQILQRKHGMHTVHRRAPGETVTDLLESAVRGLSGLRGREHLVRYVIYARGVPVSVPFPVNPVAELCQRVGLGHAISFTITHHACATSLLAIDMAGRLLAADGTPDSLALVVSGETVFTQDVELPPEARIFGEGAGAALVSRDTGADRVLSYASEQRGDLDHWAGTPDHAERFAKAYHNTLCAVIDTAVAAAGVALADVALLLPHNVNVASWRRVCGQLGFPVAKVLLDNVPRVGHIFAADLFLNHRLAAERNLLGDGTVYLAAAAGYGATFAAMVFEHRSAAC